MKKIGDFLKPNMFIIFGALLLLYFLNYLSLNGASLAIGIFAVILSTYYLVVGILGILIGIKFSPQLKKIFEVLSVSLFGAFMFIYFLLTTINGAQINGLMGPTAWIVQILSMAAALGLAVVYTIARLVNIDALMRFAYLFSAIFALALLLNILFDISGNSRLLGNVDILLVVIYVIFTFYLFSTLTNKAESKEESQEKAE
jgi:hypothetical protein